MTTVSQNRSDGSSCLESVENASKDLLFGGEGEEEKERGETAQTSDQTDRPRGYYTTSSWTARPRVSEKREGGIIVVFWL